MPNVASGWQSLTVPKNMPKIFFLYWSFLLLYFIAKEMLRRLKIMNPRFPGKQEVSFITSLSYNSKFL